MLKYCLSKLHMDVFHIATSNIIQLIKKADTMGLHFSKKQTSEFISSIIESAFEQSGKKYKIKVVSPKVDNKHDLYIRKKPLEIKVKHKDSMEWRGGAFSKRTCNYLFISYNILSKGVEWFAIQKYVKEKDWKGGNVGNYYATTIQLNDIIKNGNILIGGKTMKRTQYHPTYDFIKAK